MGTTPVTIPIVRPARLAGGDRAGSLLIPLMAARQSIAVGFDFPVLDVVQAAKNL